MSAYDLAVREKHYYVAQYLESKMAFAVSGVSSENSGNGNGGGGGTPESVASADSARASSYEDEEDFEDEEEEEAVYCGLRSKDLQEAKEQGRVNFPLEAETPCSITISNVRSKALC